MNMPFKVAIASGKGGTGKTTVSVNLFHYLHKNVSKEIQLVDCDVEEPNDAIFFPDIKIGGEKAITQLIPEIDNSRCTYCRKCADYCEFNAIVVLPPIRFAEINASLCHSCGACSYACEHNAIHEKPEPIGKATFFDTGIGNGLIEGKLKIGSAMQTLLIKELKNLVPQNNQMVLYDAPPGTSCPVVETVANVDYVILVTEPTPFGLHDLTLMVELLKEIQKPFGVIVNKAGLGNNAIYDYLHQETLELIAEIPFNQEYATRYAKGSLLADIPPEMEECYKKITQNLERRMSDYAGNNYPKR